MPSGLKVYIHLLRYSASDHLLREVQTLAQDLLKTINSLQSTAIGKCRKRIEEAAAKTKGIIGSDAHDEDAERPTRKPSCGVTSILKEKHGL
jgi:hypothetical protein